MLTLISDAIPNEKQPLQVRSILLVLEFKAILLMRKKMNMPLNDSYTVFRLTPAIKVISFKSLVTAQGLLKGYFSLDDYLLEEYFIS